MSSIKQLERDDDSVNAPKDYCVVCNTLYRNCFVNSLDINCFGKSSRTDYICTNGKKCDDRCNRPHTFHSRIFYFCFRCNIRYREIN